MASRSIATITRTVATLLTLFVALVAVGLTASGDGPFAIAVRPVFLRLGVDVDVKVGTMHLHATWSALPESTKPEAEGL